ncbi:MAG: response regulator [Deltaproteobacteria bacterium]|nr:response regulator [Deltaproteobacteria bacterium]
MEDRKRNIFIVDDEEPIRKVMNTHLTKEGYSVIQSHGGSGVFAALESNSFDLVICDIRMPEVDGIQVLDFLKKKFETVPVIMLTGLTDVTTVIEVMKKGAFDYLMKPVKKEDLMVIIRKALVHRDLLVRNKELELENREYQFFLEQKVRERTKELNSKAMELQKAYGHLKNMNIQFINVLAETIEAKDQHTRGHCNRMRCLCVELGRLAGLSPEELEILEYASLLHDLGKIGINETVLNKQGPLTEDECEHIKEHPEIGEKILQGIPLMEPVAKIIVAHHENFDGSGYPRNLRGEDIPLPARIISVADIYDAMSSDRPYRKGLRNEIVIEEMTRVAGTQLDPRIVRMFIENRLCDFNSR